MATEWPPSGSGEGHKGQANRSDHLGALGPALLIPGLAGKSQVHLSDRTSTMGMQVAT